MLSESPAALRRRVVIALLKGRQGFAAGALRQTLVAMAMQFLGEGELGWHSVFSLHISEATHLYLPIRRCYSCWLLLLSLSRVCSDVALQFCLPALVLQAELDCLEGSSSSRTEWSSGQASPPSTYPADLCVLPYVHYYSVIL